MSNKPSNNGRRNGFPKPYGHFKPYEHIGMGYLSKFRRFARKHNHKLTNQYLGYWHMTTSRYPAQR